MNTQITTTRTPRRRWISVLLGILIFIAGALVGSGVTIGFTVRTVQYLLHHPEGAPARITQALTRRLKLDPGQQQQVLAIVTKHHEAIESLRREIRPAIDAQLDQVRAEIDAVLSLDQRVKWEELFDRIRDRWMPALEAGPSTVPSQP